MHARIPSAALGSVDGRPVVVEVHVANGLPSFTIVGQPDALCREARDRVRAAIVSTGCDWPMQRITVNLAPGGLRKGGAGLDLPIALGLLVASEQLSTESVDGRAYLGELGLDGTLRTVRGLAALVDAVDVAEVVVPSPGADEAALMGGPVVRAAPDLRTVLDALAGVIPFPVHEPRCAVDAVDWPDLSVVRGQPLGRLAVELAAAGGHHLLFVGPPGAGKTLLARRLPGLLPPLSATAAREVLRLHAAAGQPVTPGSRSVPFRSPHHGASAAALVGGGTGRLRPGEISLAHHGVLLLDEMGEFPAHVLDALRQPLEQGVIDVTRAAAAVRYPARFLLVATMNPCPCGASGAPGSCSCASATRRRYLRRVSGPLLDRFDLRVTLERPELAQLFDQRPAEASEIVRRRVLQARERAVARGARVNAELGAEDLARHAPLTDGARRRLERAAECQRLSARGVHRVRAVALTLSDLDDGEPPITETSIVQALELRGAVLPQLQGRAA